MARVTVKWVIPTTRESGKPLKLSDVHHVRVEVSADGVSFANVGDFTPDVTETVLDDLDFGTWTFRGLVVDTAGRVSQPAFATVDIVDTTPPGPTVLTVTLG